MLIYIYINYIHFHVFYDKKIIIAIQFVLLFIKLKLFININYFVVTTYIILY